MLLTSFYYAYVTCFLFIELNEKSANARIGVPSKDMFQGSGPAKFPNGGSILSFFVVFGPW